MSKYQPTILEGSAVVRNFRRGTATDEEIGQYLQEKYDKNEPLTCKSVAADLDVNGKRVSSLARKYLPQMPDFYVDGEGDRWGNSRHLFQTYGLKPCKGQRLLMRYPGQIRRVTNCSALKPFGGDYYYSLDDIEAIAPKVAKRGRLISGRLSLKRTDLRDKPADLSENEYKLFLILASHALRCEPWLSHDKLSEKYSLGGSEATRRNVHSLCRKGYISIRRQTGVKGNPYEYRFLKGPKSLIETLRKLDVTLNYEFSKEADK